MYIRRVKLYHGHSFWRSLARHKTVYSRTYVPIRIVKHNQTNLYGGPSDCADLAEDIQMFASPVDECSST